MPIDEQLQKEQALAIQSLVKTNTRLQKIEDALNDKLAKLKVYNTNNSQIVTTVLESELRRIKRAGD